MPNYRNSHGKTHREDDLSPEAKEELRENPSLLSEAANFANIAAQYRLITSQDLNTAAQAVNNVLNANLTFEGTKQFARDIQVFQRLNIDAYSKSGVFSSAETAGEYLKNATEGQLEYLKKRLTGTAQEIDWLRLKQSQLSSVLEKSALLNNNAAGVDGETISRLTGKTISRTTVKAAVGNMGLDTNVKDVAEAVHKGTATEQDIILGVKGTKEAARNIGLNNPVQELNTAETMKDSTERLARKIEQGKAAASVTAQEAAKKMCQGAVIGAAVSLTISGVTNYIKYKNGKITLNEAFRDVG